MVNALEVAGPPISEGAHGKSVGHVAPDNQVKVSQPENGLDILQAGQGNAASQPLGLTALRFLKRQQAQGQ